MSTDIEVEHRIRAMVFVDFWNFQLSINNIDSKFKIDWQVLGQVVAQESLRIVDANALLSYQGMKVYGSYDQASKKDQSLHHWAMNTLNKFPGVSVTMIQRQRKRSGPFCPSCYQEMSTCPSCRSDMRGTEEKGVDTRIATDMIKFAWVNNYDVAVLLSSDRDFVPVVEFLSTRGIRTIHGAFPPQGSILTQTCWGNIRLGPLMEKFRRT